MKTLVLSCALAAGIAGSAGAVTLDFDTMNGPAATTPGDITGNEFTDFGVTIGLTGETTQLALFNSNCGPDFAGTPCTGGDTDLATGPSYGSTPEGRVLIGQEPGLGEPGDLPGTYTFSFAFDPVVNFNKIRMIDLDEAAFNDKIFFTFSFLTGPDQTFSGDADLLPRETLLNPAFPADNSVRDIVFNLDGVTGLDVGFVGISGAIASLDYAPVPLPAALPLLAAGLGALGVAARRRKA